MHRFHLAPAQCQRDILTLEGREAHHGLNVLRLRLRDPAIVLDGEGTEYTCTVAATGRDTLRLAIKARRLVPKSLYQLTLLQALPKGKLINSIIEKATELGATRVIPLVTERVVTHLDDSKADAKREHWQSAAIEAIKQCGAAWMPQIESPLTPAQFIARGDVFDLPFIASLQPGSRHPREYFESFRSRAGRVPESICCWVGPEGDFTPEEVAAIQAAGALPITLGPNVLRADTAAVYCLSILSYELQAPAQDCARTPIISGS